MPENNPAGQTPQAQAREPARTQIALDDIIFIGRCIGLAGDHQGGPITIVIGAETVTVDRAALLRVIKVYGD